MGGTFSAVQPTEKKDDFSWKKLLRQMRKVFFKKLQSRRGLVKKKKASKENGLASLLLCHRDAKENKETSYS